MPAKSSTIAAAVSVFLIVSLALPASLRMPTSSATSAVVIVSTLRSPEDRKQPTERRTVLDARRFADVDAALLPSLGNCSQGRRGYRLRQRRQVGDSHPSQLTSDPVAADLRLARPAEAAPVAGLEHGS
jgi:hypothetical protein